MRARDVVGRRIVGVRQERVRGNSGRAIYHVDAFVLDDGTVVNFDTADMEHDTAIEATVWPPAGKRRRGA
jgi:hypothetical protein